jgi:hypothetical protein
MTLTVVPSIRISDMSTEIFVCGVMYKKKRKKFNNNNNKEGNARGCNESRCGISFILQAKYGTE